MRIIIILAEERLVLWRVVKGRHMEAAADEQSCRQVASKINVETLKESYHLVIRTRAFCIQYMI